MRGVPARARDPGRMPSRGYSGVPRCDRSGYCGVSKSFPHKEHYAVRTKEDKGARPPNTGVIIRGTKVLVETLFHADGRVVLRRISGYKNHVKSRL